MSAVSKWMAGNGIAYVEPTDKDSVPGDWLPDPTDPTRLRWWNGQQWSDHVDENGEVLIDPMVKFDGIRWQYSVVNIGSFGAMSRMASVLGLSGSQGWELVGVYDKASNWFQGMEKGFMLFKRPVPVGVKIADDQWCVDLGEAKP